MSSGPFATHTLSWHRCSASFLPPLLTHYLDNNLARQLGRRLIVRAVQLPALRGCTKRGSFLFFVFFVASFQPDGTGKEKWLPSVTFCQAVTQGGVGGANVSPTPPSPWFVESTRPSVGFTLLPVSICVWPSLAVSGSGRGHARFAASREMSC